MFGGDDEQLGELQRRLGNTVRVGTIREIDYGRARARVQIGPVLTDWVPWGTARAGGDRTWDPPEIGEQVMLASPAGDLRQGAIIGSFYQTAHAAPGDRAGLSRTIRADGTVEEYDRDSHTLTVTVVPEGKIIAQIGPAKIAMTKETATLSVGASAIEITASSITLHTARLIIDAPEGGAGMHGDLSVTGHVAVQGNVDVTGQVIDTGGNTNHHSH